MPKSSNTISSNPLFKRTAKKTDLVSPFGNRLKKERLALGLSQSQVAHKVGVSDNTTVSRWETGESVPKLDTFLDLCKLYRKTPNELLNFKG